MRPNLFKAILIVVGLAFLTTPAKADSVTIGLPALPNNGNCIPFSCSVLQQVTSYQQIYTSSAFSGTELISGLDFFDTQVLNGAIPGGGTYTLDLSYSSKAVGSLSLASLASNIGFGSQEFFSGTLPPSSGGVMAFAGTPFLYDPSLGNLLLTVQFSGVTDSNPFLFLDFGATSTETSRAAFGTFPFQDFGGLVTRFDFSTSAVPEPSSLRMLGAGLLVLIGFSLKKLVA